MRGSIFNFDDVLTRILYWNLTLNMIIFYIVCWAIFIIQGFLDYPAAADFWNNAIETTGIIVETDKRSECTTSYAISSPPSFPSTPTTPTTPTPTPHTSCSTYFISTIQFETQQEEIMTFESDPDMCVDRPNSTPCNGRKVEVIYDSTKGASQWCE
jgi:hypothetical protein